jgi:CHRD domain
MALTMPGPTTVCFGVNVIGLDRVTAMQIRAGTDSETGPVRLDLQPIPQVGQPSSGCVSNVPVALVSDLRNDPAQFYLNITTARFPNGAVRGQFFPTPGTGGAGVWPWIIGVLAVLVAAALGVIVGQRLGRRSHASVPFGRQDAPRPTASL